MSSSRRRHGAMVLSPGPKLSLRSEKEREKFARRKAKMLEEKKYGELATLVGPSEALIEFSRTDNLEGATELWQQYQSEIKETMELSQYYEFVDGSTISEADLSAGLAVLQHLDAAFALRVFVEQARTWADVSRHAAVFPIPDVVGEACRQQDPALASLALRKMYE
eukprot:gene5514-986_t